MKTPRSLRSFLALSGSSLLAISSANAQTRTIYWDGISSSWGTANNWSTASGATTPNPNPGPGVFDLAVFNITTVNNAQTVTLDDVRSILGITFNNTNTTAITANASGTTNRTLTIGNNGITLGSTSGAVTLGNGGTNGQVLLSLAAGAQTWTNLSASNLTINNTAATFTRAAGATLTFNQANTGVFSMSTTVLPNDATGIVGPWSFFGTGTSQRYAFNNAGTIAGYSGGTAAAGAENFTSASTNYDFDGSGTNTLTTNRTAHTIRYTGTGHTIDLGASGANTLTANGILAVGSSGTLTIQRTGGTGSLVIGSFNDLVIGGTQNVNISAPITGASGNLTYAGSGTLTLSGANTYGGATTVGSGTLIVDGTSVLPTATLVNIGNAAGTTFQINNNTTIGNLSGNGSLGTVALQGNTLTLGNASATTYNGQFTGTSGSGIIKQGAGTLTLGNVTNIPGTLTINAGTWLNNQSNLSGGTITLNANGATLQFASNGGGSAGVSGLGGGTISNAIVLGNSVTTTGAKLFASGNQGKWNFTGGITGASGASGAQTLFFDTRAGGSVGGDRTTTTISGVIANGNTALNLNFAISPQSGSAANAHPTYVNLTGLNTFTGSITATRANAGNSSWLVIGGERWADGGNNTPSYGRMGSGRLGDNASGVYAGNFALGGTAGNIVNLGYFSSADQTWSGTIGTGGVNNNGALVKEGTGTLTLTNANGYNGVTTIGGGTLALGFNTTTTNILPTTTALHMGLGSIYDPIPANADMTISGGGGGGTLELAGASNSATYAQTVASLTTNANTSNRILLSVAAGSGTQTLTVTSPTLTIGANSGLNFNLVAGGANGATIGTGRVVLTGNTSVGTLNSGWTVSDADGFGLAGTNASNQVIRNTSTAALPTSGGSSATNYLTTSSAGNSVTASQSAGSITTDTTGGNVTLTLDPGVTLSNNIWNFGGVGSNTAQVTGGTGVRSAATGNTIVINNFNTGTVTFNSPIIAFGTNALVVGGTGTVALAGVNTFSGATTVNSGNLQIIGSGSLNSGTYAGNIGINGGSKLIYSSNATQTLSGIISGPGGLTKDTDASVLTLSGTNLYTGSTTVNAGTLRAGAAAGGQAFGAGSAVTLANTSGVTLDLNGFSQTIGSLAGGGTTGGNVTLGSNATLTAGGNNANTTYAGVISGTGTSGLAKVGAGTLVITGINTYTGATTVTGGTLAVNGSLTNTSGVTVKTGATLQGSGSIVGSVTIEGGGTHAAGNSIQSLAEGALTLNANSTFAYEIDRSAAANVAGDLTAVTGNLTLALTNDAILTLTDLGGSGTWTFGEKLTLISYTGTWNAGLFEYDNAVLADDSIFTFSGTQWLFNYNDTLEGTNFASESNGTFVTMTAVPETSTALLSGLGALALLRRRRR